MNELVENYVGVFRNWSNFSGRARRREFWMFTLGNIIAGILLGIVSAVLGRLGALVVGLWSLAIVVPSLAVAVRRLHDTGRSGFWLLISLVPLIGGLAVLYFYVQEGQPGTNEYGPNPKESAFAYA